MYVRPQNSRYSSEFRLPENYSGNTFREHGGEIEEAELPEDSPKEEATADKKDISAEDSETAALLTQSEPCCAKKPFSLFGKGTGTNEELLILALILLLSDGDGNDDLIIFLMLLLFIK